MRPNVIPLRSMLSLRSGHVNHAQSINMLPALQAGQAVECEPTGEELVRPINVIVRGIGVAPPTPRVVAELLLQTSILVVNGYQRT